MMTPLLAQVVAQLQQLPAADQDMYAAILLAEIVDDARWRQQFAVSQEELARLAAEVRRDLTKQKK
jgi:hypothetical protein